VYAPPDATDFGPLLLLRIAENPWFETNVASVPQQGRLQ
jgi:hypothetical protein